MSVSASESKYNPQLARDITKRHKLPYKRKNTSQNIQWMELFALIGMVFGIWLSPTKSYKPPVFKNGLRACTVWKYIKQSLKTHIHQNIVAKPRHLWLFLKWHPPHFYSNTTITAISCLHMLNQGCCPHNPAFFPLLSCYFWQHVSWKFSYLTNQIHFRSYERCM